MLPKINVKTTIFFSLAFFSISFLFFLVHFYLQKTPPYAHILHQPYPFLSAADLRSRLVQDFTLPDHISFSGPNELGFNLDTASISAEIDYHQTASQLFSLNPANYFRPQRFPLIINFDQSALANQIASISAQVEKPFVPPQIELNSQRQIVVKNGQLGQQLDQASLKQLIVTHLAYQQVHPISLPINSVGFVPSQSQTDATQNQAQKLVGKSLILTGDFDPVTLNDQTLISWLDFQGGFDQSKQQEFISNLAQSLQRQPVNAIFQFDNAKVTQFRPAKDGLEVNQDQLLSQLQTNLETLLNSPDTSISFAIPVTYVAPLVKTEDANNLGIKQLLGSGTSTFKHSSTIRNFNIEKGSSIVNRILVPPGENFSFLQHLGEVTLEAGYKKAYIIRQGRTELDVGGGICQVSTTLFRAMLNSGLNIIERQPHAFRVSYYEEDSPPGYDATVFIPSPDLKFINDTGHHVLIQNTFDPQEKRLTYEIYGTSDGRQVEISNYRKWGYSNPPPTRYIDDPTLAPGQLVKEETAVPGLNVAFDWKVTRDGQVVHQKTFQSKYVPWAAVYRRGI